MMNRYSGFFMAAAVSAALLFASLPVSVWAAEARTVSEEVSNGTEEAEDGLTGEEDVREGGDEEQTGEEQQDTAWPAGPAIVGEAGIVMEVSTGTILYSKNIHGQYYPASITKILTALLVIENCAMDEMVTIPHEAVYMEDKGSHIALDEGEELTVEDCLYGLLLASANDAAYALAIHVSGSIEAFADLMNQRAQELGCVDSHFVNPHGLPDEEHVSSAYDMALITREVLKHEIFRTISGTVFYEIQPSDKQPDLIPMSNHHDMLTATRYHYDGAFAGKTGYTVVAKNTLVTCAGRDGMELICVTMKTDGKQVYVDTASLLDFGFENFRLLDIPSNLTDSVQARVFTGLSGGEGMMENVPVRLVSGGQVAVPTGVTFGQLDASIRYDRSQAREGDSVDLEYTYAGRSVGKAELSLPASMVPAPEPEETEESVGGEIAAKAEPEESRESSFSVWKLLLVLLLLAAVVGAGGLVVRRAIWKYRWKKRRRSLGRNRYAAGGKRRTPGSGERRSGSHAKTTDSEADKESLAEKEEEDLVWESDVLGEARSPRDDEEEQKGSGEIEFL